MREQYWLSHKGRLSLHGFYFRLNRPKHLHYFYLCPKFELSPVKLMR